MTAAVILPLVESPAGRCGLLHFGFLRMFFFAFLLRLVAVAHLSVVQTFQCAVCSVVAAPLSIPSDGAGTL